MNYKEIENKIKQAVKVRESGNLEQSRPLFESILKDLRELMKSDTSKEVKYIFATATGEYIIQYRLEGPEKFEEALRLGAELLYFDKQNELNNPLSIRSVSNTLLNMEKYTEAEPFLEALIPLYNGNSAQEGDTKAHLAFCYLNTGKIEQAVLLIDEALSLIEKNTSKKEKSFITTWMSHALIVKSLILSAQHNAVEAEKYAQNSLKIAIDGKNLRRELQARKVLEYLKKIK